MTNTAKHTPGPWFKVTGDAVSNTTGPNWLADAHIVATGLTPGNATLIAAAPAMYLALLDMIDLAEVSIQFDEDDEVKALDRARISKARQALAQAEGR